MLSVTFAFCQAFRSRDFFRERILLKRDVIDNINREISPEVEGEFVSSPDVLMIGAYPEWDMAPLESAYTLHKLWLAENKDAFLERNSANVRAIATRGELGAPRVLIDRCPRLELIACYGVGVDAIDLARAAERGVHVTNTPNVLTEDVADFAFALILASLRKVAAGDAHVRSGGWKKTGALALGTSLRGKTIGVLGFGRIGRAIARRVAGFEAAVAYCDVAPAADTALAFHPDPVSLAKACDILVTTVAGGEGTRNIVDAEVLDALGPAGLFVNVARGSVVDEDALIDALSRNRIGGVCLDVFWNEPNIDERFLGLDNVLLAPHQSSGTVQTRKAMGQLVRDNLAAHFSGRPLLTPVV
jgi:lactate dehydrogenase-like 2-hydroxyacid dehydrogenase